MEKNDLAFFQQATNMICKSLDIKTSLENCFEFLGKKMPVNGIAMNIYDPEKKIVKNIAMVSDLGAKEIKRFEQILLTREAVDYIENLPPVCASAQIINSPGKQIVADLVWKAMGKPGISFLLLHPVVEKIKLGVVFIFAKGVDQYKPEHARLFSILHDPFAIALSNTVRYQEILRLKEMLVDDNRYLKTQLHQIAGDQIIGRNLGLKKVMEMVGQVAFLTNHVLILGETGVGKEVIANAIHYSSPRANAPFIKVNCGAIPETLIDSELFGHEQGAFTGAVKRYRGCFERADKGTIFLDEIGELSSQAQVRLLRVIQDKKIEPVGGSGPISLDVRIIVATHRNLGKMVENGSFRQDLWFRLNVFPIKVPPLRERLCDIPDLVTYFIGRKSREMNVRLPPVPGPDFVQTLRSHHWPGNVRELENVIERALIRSLSARPNGPLMIDPLEFQALGRGKKIGLCKVGYDLDSLVRQHIIEVLGMTKGRVKGDKGAAALLGINPSTLRNRMTKLGIDFGKKIREP